MMSRLRITIALAGALTAAAALSSCATAQTATAADRAALALLSEVAGPTSGVEEERITSTACWMPSEHLLDDPSASETTWKVLCRVDWTAEDGEARFQDTTCIGDFAVDPMLERCYRWTHYDQMPGFADAPSVPAS